jgi:predicted CXXCH cytochrome family protein
MQEAKEQTVLGDFGNATFTYAGTTSTFFKRDGKHFVRTDGPDGKLADYGVKYTFGVAPLQQYLIELPGGRLQALSIAWDTRARSDGGQRWFHLYPDENITHNDELHWTGRLQNWNHICSECHSTGVEKNYDPSARRYRTTWTEINVTCEACHGPASRHIAWARREPGWELTDARIKGLEVLLEERRNVVWSHDPQSGNPQRVGPRGEDKEVQICARCHSRRSQLSADYRHGRPLMDTHDPVLLRQGLYHPDGQIDDEVYEYGSFIQSRMYRAGVTCSNCHEPHGLKLRAPGNGVCLQCHDTTKYDAAKHHFHSPGSRGAVCIECHMPTKTYMIVDPRRDHSFRVPRPDLSMQFGVPNACTSCHRDRTAEWAAEKVRNWYRDEPKGYQRFGEALHAARTGAVDAETRLTALLRDVDQPAIARATAALELASRLSPVSLSVLGEAIRNADPLVRAGALEGLQALPPDQLWQLAHPLLRDPVRSIRIKAAGALAGFPADRLSAGVRADYDRATDEFVKAQRLNADQPEAHVNLGNLYAAREEAALAEQAYRTALDLDANWVPAYVNLADLFRRVGRDPDGARILRTGLARLPRAASIHHSLGLLLVRQRNLPVALASLKTAADLEPQDARYSYVYAVALHSAGRTREALAIVNASLVRTPSDRLLIQLQSELSRLTGPR